VDESDSKGEKKKKTIKVLRKIPPEVIKEAQGIVIFTAMRSGIAPFGGAGGTGVVLARLPDGCQSESPRRQEVC
jgi:lipid-binding SYLF domain-containing protein